jgi:hypothetical protein
MAIGYGMGALKFAGEVALAKSGIENKFGTQN